MAKKTEELVTYVLTQKVPTTYQKADGTFFDTPVSKRIVPEYTKYEENRIRQVRHIRNANSIFVDEQSGSTFNKKRDNIFFNNGILVLNPMRDRITMEFLDNHPQNHDTPAESRRDGVFPIFRKVVPEKEGSSNVDNLEVNHKAMEMILALRTKSGDSFEYKEKQIGMMSRIFGINGSLAPSQVITELAKIATNDPAGFIYKANHAVGEVEQDLEAAITLGIIRFDKKTAFLNKEVLFVAENPMPEDQMKREILSYLLTTQGDDKYEAVKELLIQKKSESKKIPNKAKAED